MTMRQYNFKKGHKPWNKNLKGIHLSPKTEFKKGRKDEKHPEWKGEDASYVAIHQWIVRWKGRPDMCEMCGKSGLRGKNIHWANIDHKYKRILDDYIRLCASCHYQYDRKFNNKKSLVLYTKRCQKLQNHD